MSIKRYKRYPEYKASGVEFLGSIPVGWMVINLGRVAAVRSGKFLPNSEFDSSPAENRTVKIYGGNGVMGYGECSNIVSPSIIIGRVGAQCGNVHVILPPAWVTDNALLLTNLKKISLKYLAHVIPLQKLNDFSIENAQPLITGTMVKSQKVCLPSESEQLSIIEYVDKRLAEINELINAKHLLIRLLEEKRTALITRAVTKGLDPNVPMKDSGVEWLGAIPAHWRATTLGTVCDIVSGFAFASQTYVSDGIAIVRISDIELCEITKMKRVPSELAQTHKRFHITRGDVLIALTGATIGKSSQFALDGTFLLNQRVARLRAKESSAQNYLSLLIASSCIKEQIHFNCGGGAQDNIGVPQLQHLHVAMPPVAEHIAISKYLQQVSQHCNRAIKKIHSAIEYIQELRTAVISAAVTGKIDVREEAV